MTAQPSSFPPGVTRVTVDGSLLDLLLWSEALPLWPPSCWPSREVTDSVTASVEEDSVTLPSQSKGLFTLLQALQVDFVWNCDEYVVPLQQKKG